MLGLPLVPPSHQLSPGEPACDRERKRDDVRPLGVVREDDLREDHADGEADERTDDAGHNGHPMSEAPNGLGGKRIRRQGPGSPLRGSQAPLA